MDTFLGCMHGGTSGMRNQSKHHQCEQQKGILTSWTQGAYQPSKTTQFQKIDYMYNSEL